jgi:hypothetical protein
MKSVTKIEQWMTPSGMGVTISFRDPPGDLIEAMEWCMVNNVPFRYGARGEGLRIQNMEVTHDDDERFYTMGNPTPVVVKGPRRVTINGPIA